MNAESKPNALDALRALEKELERMESFGCRCGRLSEGICKIHEYAANVKQHIRTAEAAAPKLRELVEILQKVGEAAARQEPHIVLCAGLAEAVSCLRGFHQHIRESEAAACHGGQCRDELLWRKSIETEVAAAYERCIAAALDWNHRRIDPHTAKSPGSIVDVLRALAAASQSTEKK